MTVAVAAREGTAKNYAAALAGVGLNPLVTTDVGCVQGCGGLVLPGGGDVEPSLYGAENRGSKDIDLPLDKSQLRMLEAFLAAGKPVLGICKGCQLLNIHFGGTLIQHLSTAETHAWSEGDRIHLCRSISGSAIEEIYGGEYTVNSLHHQALAAIGEGFRVTSAAPDGVVESIEHESLPVFGVQWHPERLCFAKARPDAVDGGEVFRRFKSLL